jgi:hypothetical protein
MTMPSINNMQIKIFEMLMPMFVLFSASVFAQQQNEVQLKPMIMKKQDYHIAITVNATAQEAFKNISNVSKWWSENVEGRTQKLNDVFTVHFGETWITHKIVEIVPDKKIVWLVTDCNKHWLKDKKEWKGTKMEWEISTDKNTTKINFTHIGLVPVMECYKGCEKAWNEYIQESLYKLLAEGKGEPDLK